MNHPEGRVLAIQQQMFLATLLSDSWGLKEEVILHKLATVGLMLAIDTNEIAVDAAVILPRLDKEKQPNLKAVKTGDSQ